MAWSPAVAGLFVTLSWATGAMAASEPAAEDRIAECHRSAAHPEDLSRVGAKVSWEAMDAGAAIVACEAAVSARPADARLHFQLGRALAKAERAQEAIAAYQVAADAGFALALVEMGDLHQYGHGAEKDAAKAAELYSRAREAGSPVGTAFLADLHFAGDGVAEDRNKAVALYREAAAAGYPYAQYVLGLLHEQGIGVAQDDAQAVHWYRPAAAQGLALAQTHLAIMHEKGRGGLRRDPAAAAQLYRLAADQVLEQGSYRAALNLGILHRRGEGVPSDEKEAERLFRYAQGDTEPDVVETAKRQLEELLAGR